MCNLWKFNPEMRGQDFRYLQSFCPSWVSYQREFYLHVGWGGSGLQKRLYSQAFSTYRAFLQYAAWSGFSGCLSHRKNGRSLGMDIWSRANPGVSSHEFRASKFYCRTCRILWSYICTSLSTSGSPHGSRGVLILRMICHSLEICIHNCDHVLHAFWDVSTIVRFLWMFSYIYLNSICTACMSRRSWILPLVPSLEESVSQIVLNHFDLAIVLLRLLLRRESLFFCLIGPLCLQWF